LSHQSKQQTPARHQKPYTLGKIPSQRIKNKVCQPSLIHKLLDRDHFKLAHYVVTEPNLAILFQPSSLSETPNVIKMSDKLDSSLDEILATRRVGHARNARKDLRRKAPAGGVKKAQKPVKGAVKAGPIASAPEQLASKILIENLVCGHLAPSILLRYH
jgi:hypothetical protein